MGNRGQNWRVNDLNQHKRTLAVLLGLLLMAWPPAESAAYHPTRTQDFGDPARLSLPDDVARYLGQALVSQLRRDRSLARDPVSQAYVRAFGASLKKRQRGQHPMQFLLASNDNINAFAAPGGTIVVFTGLITRTHNPSELGGVLSHEMAHVTQHHLARMLADRKRQIAPVAAGIIAAVAASAAGRPDLAAGALISAQSQSISTQLHQNRHFEHEADRMGMQNLQDSGLNPGGLPDFLERMQQHHMAYGQNSDYFSTHPLLNDRIADTRARASSSGSKQTKSVNKVFSPSYFALIQTRIRAITQVQSNAYKSAYEKRSEQNPDDVISRYGLMQYHLHNHALGKAGEEAQILRQSQPSNPLFAYDMAAILTQQLRHHEAISLLNAIPNATAQDHALNIPKMALLADNYQALHHWSLAESTLKQLIKVADCHTPDHLTQLAMVQAKQGRVADAYLSRAEALALDLQWDTAMRQLDQALKQNNLAARDQRKLKHARAQYKQQRDRFKRVMR